MPHQCTNCGHTFADGSKEMLSGCPECGGNKFQFLPAGADAEDLDADAAAPDRSAADGVSGAVGKAAATVRDLVSDDPDPPDIGASDVEETTIEPSADDTETASDGSAASVGDSAADEAGASASDAEAPTDPDSDPDVAEPREAEGVADPDSAATVGDPTEADEVADPTEAEDAAQASARTEMVSSTDLPDRPPSDGRVVKEPDADVEEPDMEALRAELNDQFESIKVVAPGQYELNLMELYDREEYIIALRENGRYVIEVPDVLTESNDRRNPE